MHRRHYQGPDSLWLATLALAVVVGKIVSAGMREPRSHNELPLLAGDGLPVPAAAAISAPADQGSAGVPLNGAGASIHEPVESAPCDSRPGEDVPKP